MVTYGTLETPPLCYTLWIVGMTGFWGQISLRTIMWNQVSCVKSFTMNHHDLGWTFPSETSVGSKLEINNGSSGSLEPVPLNWRDSVFKGVDILQSSNLILTFVWILKSYSMNNHKLRVKSLILKPRGVPTPHWHDWTT